MKIYAVKNGRNTGIFLSWAECEAQVKGFSGAQYKSFKNMEEAHAYLTNSVVTEAPTSYLSVQHTPSTSSDSDRLDVYVDGSFSNGQYGWGFVIYSNGKMIHSDYGIGTNTNAACLKNVAGELAASMRAVKWAVNNKKMITIHHDYIGVEAWVTGRWKTKNYFTTQYAMFMNKFRNVFVFNHVKGHSGVAGNTVADKLARKALGI